jgi:hypothetical protein
MTKGLMVKMSKDPEDIAYRHCGLALNPSPMPVTLYNESLRMQHVMGILHSNLCSDPQ